MDATFVKSAYSEKHYPAPEMPEIAFAGKSNVGKSSLLNVLANRKKLARTSSTPGRTQAINFFIVENSLSLVDLPGYGFAKVPAAVKQSWGRMVETYLRTRPNLKAVVVILDIRRDPSALDHQLLTWLKDYGVSAIIVLTKADKLSRQKALSRTRVLKQAFGKLSPFPLTVFSAKTRQGKREVWENISKATGWKSAASAS